MSAMACASDGAATRMDDAKLVAFMLPATIPDPALEQFEVVGGVEAAAPREPTFASGLSWPIAVLRFHRPPNCKERPHDRPRLASVFL